MIAEGYFAWRSDSFLDLRQPFSSHIFNLYENGFDAICNDQLIYFACAKERLNPMALLVPERVLAAARQNQQVSYASARLKIGTVELLASEPVTALPMVEACRIDGSIIADNLVRVFNNIKLFGRSSPVKDLVLGCKTAENMLSAVEAELEIFPPDFKRIVAFLGFGEGLTPSFDDFISGMLLADRRARFGKLSIPADFFAQADSRTTRQSAQQLRFAASGLLNPRIELFVDRLMSEKVSSAMILQAMDMGHSSGTDLVCGVYYYLRNALALNQRA